MKVLLGITVVFQAICYQTGFISKADNSDRIELLKLS